MLCKNKQLLCHKVAAAQHRLKDSCIRSNNARKYEHNSCSMSIFNYLHPLTHRTMRPVFDFQTFQMTYESNHSNGMSLEIVINQSHELAVTPFLF